MALQYINFSKRKERNTFRRLDGLISLCEESVRVRYGTRVAVPLPSPSANTLRNADTLRNATVSFVRLPANDTVALCWYLPSMRKPNNAG